MLDRALWALEAAWHPGFTPATAACRLDYGVEENRPLFGALFRHVQVWMGGWVRLSGDEGRGRGWVGLGV